LRGLLAEAMKNAGLSFPKRERGFHLLNKSVPHLREGAGQNRLLHYQSMK
jgi:hypothetical protein